MSLDYAVIEKRATEVNYAGAEFPGYVLALLEDNRRQARTISGLSSSMGELIARVAVLRGALERIAQDSDCDHVKLLCNDDHDRALDDAITSWRKVKGEEP